MSTTENEVRDLDRIAEQLDAYHEAEEQRKTAVVEKATAAAMAAMDQITSTPEGRAEVERIGGKDVALTRFQEANGISERIAEAAIKEWVLTHNGNFDWNLEDVKAICLRNKRSGIPYQYLPESEK